ncbi:hypothetical protein F5884DRAFT_24367 [Xylogone sp. PMI_703]|nr:hypothetical protein F5884DRAFT_24367 [Xylogone sp. PMI_703]
MATMAAPLSAPSTLATSRWSGGGSGGCWIQPVSKRRGVNSAGPRWFLVRLITDEPGAVVEGVLHSDRRPFFQWLVMEDDNILILEICAADVRQKRMGFLVSTSGYNHLLFSRTLPERHSGKVSSSRLHTLLKVAVHQRKNLKGKQQENKRRDASRIASRLCILLTYIL